MSSTDSPSTFTVASPFDDLGADVILRSSDAVDFHVYRLVLALASPFFKQMFSLPQPSTEPEVPIIVVTESATALDRALRFWYPGASPITAQTLDDLRETLDMLIAKYDMQFLIPTAKKHLREFIHNDPVAVYAMACNHGWKDVALEAAKASLTIPIRDCDSPGCPQLEYITGRAYHRLLHYHFQCGKVASLAASSPTWKVYPLGRVPCQMPFRVCPSDATVRKFANGSRVIPAWFAGYLEGLSPALAKTPDAPQDLIDELLALAFRSIPRGCSDCSPTGIEDLIKFTSELQAHISQEIDSVQLF